MKQFIENDVPVKKIPKPKFPDVSGCQMHSGRASLISEFHYVYHL